MGLDPNALRGALRQFIATDRLFNVRSVPIPGELTARLGRPTPPPAPAPPAPLARSTTPPRPAPPSAPRELGKPASAPRPGVVIPATSGSKAERLAALDRESVQNCRACRLCTGRSQTVFADGTPDTRLVFVGEGPGFEEDRQGLPFVGPAGQLLNRMIAAMGLRREQVYICNVVKCRPPNNRTPMEDEMQACSPYLFEQLRIVEPEIIVSLGAPATQTLLRTKLPLGRQRGRFHDFRLPYPDGTERIIPLMPTYHPAYLLRYPNEKVKTWEDLQQVMARMGLPLPQ